MTQKELNGLINAARKYTNNKQDAEDIAMNAVLAVLKKKDATITSTAAVAHIYLKNSYKMTMLRPRQIFENDTYTYCNLVEFKLEHHGSYLSGIESLILVKELIKLGNFKQQTALLRMFKSGVLRSSVDRMNLKMYIKTHKDILNN